MKDFKGLDTIKVGDKVKVISIKHNKSVKQRLKDIGITENSEVECVGVSPLGDPIAFLVRGTVVAIRKCDCKQIIADYGCDEE